MVVGQVLAGRYELVERVGGMGEVWRATDQELRRDVAIERAVSGDVWHEVHHPNIVAVHDVIDDGDDRFQVMEYFPARSLADILHTDGALPPRDAAEIGAQVAGALVAMHAKGMAHRDITPGDVLVAEDGTTKLTGLWSVGPPTDLYSLGATLFAAVEGTPYQPQAVPQRAEGLAPVITGLVQPDPSNRPTAQLARQMLLKIAEPAPYSLAVRVGMVAMFVALVVITVLVVVDN
ncbi:serine/threonine-protein kinase [Kibdelosporangium phytohabitans]|uniref:non-specific serine/threonine protein kinase n=1 Tax=Kibdelosporangium phytohabitans TaxID=860235 RepID=A0A0N9I5I1_9PSEU|nr:serine/threonine-protein kinase [Kibdelosporangium phytohabitans]ALG11169.1 hypothetical protein AOZ06_33640 [Kibdelosporangium phytohabitans]MBE1462428.1 serine/threonine protein kinase [Kibdelosporangium phytohabitans]